MSPSRISRCSFGWEGQQSLASCSNYGTWRSGGGKVNNSLCGYRRYGHRRGQCVSSFLCRTQIILSRDTILGPLGVVAGHGSVLMRWVVPPEVSE